MAAFIRPFIIICLSFIIAHNTTYSCGFYTTHEHEEEHEDEEYERLAEE
ncbi:hypothetical protein PQO01_01610 [Lentisphaera marina]|nr:hypothetical protein [Lentisphaera marina]MDD7983644.1 hypothetical protein [Lentisphaera marina]